MPKEQTQEEINQRTMCYHDLKKLQKKKSYKEIQPKNRVDDDTSCYRQVHFA